MRNLACFLPLAILVLSGCGSGPETPFDRDPTEPVKFSGSSPSLPKQTQYCFQDHSGAYTQAISMEHGHDRTRRLDWSQGGACIFRSLADVWALLRDQKPMVWGGVTRATASRRADPPRGVQYFFEVKYFVDSPFPEPDVDWTMAWYHSIPEGEPVDRPSRVLVNYGKIRGTSFIHNWNGSIILEALTPTVTSISLRDEIDAAQTGPEDSESGLRDIVGKLRRGASP